MERTERYLPILVGLAVHALLTVIALWPAARRPFGDERTYRAAAEALRSGEPFSPDLLWPPLYARLLAWIPGEALLTGLQVAALAAAIVLLRGVLARLLPQGTQSVRYATLWLATYPPLAAFAHYRWPEVPHLLWFSGILWILITGRRSWPWMVLLGALVALALATKSLLGPFLPVLLWPLAREPKGLQRVAAVAGLAFLLLLPTMLENARREGRFAVASSAAFNLWVGLNEGAADSGEDASGAVSLVVREARTYRASAATAAERDRILWRKIRSFVRQRGLATVLRDQVSSQYGRLFAPGSFLTDQLPGGAIAELGAGYRQTPAGLAWILRFVSWGMYLALLVGAAVGLVGWLWKGRGLSLVQRRWWWVLGLFLVYNLGLFLVLHVKTRYRIQMLPALVFFAALGGALLDRNATSSDRAAAST
ncbi:MAG: hypothetical protein AAF481_13390 [Acidobacteriota bacterium]